jgi:hypothetical protein
LNPVSVSSTRCLFEVFISIISKAQVQMCFAPADEKGFFDALGSGAFDAKAVCSTIDAMKAMASVEEDKTMITERIKEEVGIYSYNEQVRQFVEQQYKFVALRSRGRQLNRSGGAKGHSGSSSAQHRAGGDSSGGDDLAEVVKHLRRLDLRLGAMEKKQEEVAKEVAKKQDEMAKEQEEVAKEVAKKQEEMMKKQEAIEKELGVATSQLGAVEKNQHVMMARERPLE